MSSSFQFAFNSLVLLFTKIFFLSLFSLGRWKVETTEEFLPQQYF